MYHPKADIDWLHVKRKGGGRGLLQIEVTFKAEIIIVAEYLYTKHNIDKSHESSRPYVISTIKQQQRLARIVGELNHSNENSETKRKT